MIARLHFLNGLLDDILTVSTEMLLCLFIQFFWIDWFPIFNDHVCFLDTWKLVFKDGCGIVHTDWNNRTSGLRGDF